jgi:hypothetical protein
MINLTSSGGTITFAFDNNSGYLQNGTIEVPVNSLSLVIDESDMVTFKKANSKDVFVSAIASDFGMSKAQLISLYKDNMVGSTGGGTDTGTVQTMIDESISGKADTSAVTASIEAAVSGKASQSDLETVSGQVATKQDILSAGTGIDITNNIISATGGGGGEGTVSGYTYKNENFSYEYSDAFEGPVYIKYDGDSGDSASNKYAGSIRLSDSEWSERSYALYFGISNGVITGSTTSYPFITISIENGIAAITSTSGYYIIGFDGKSDFVGYVEKVYSSGNTSDVVENTVYDMLDNLSDGINAVNIKQAYFGLSKGTLNLTLEKGSSTFGASAALGSPTINTDGDRLNAQFATPEASQKVLNTGQWNLCDISGDYTYNGSYDDMTITFNSGYTGSSTSEIMYIRFYSSGGSSTDQISITYNITANTISYDASLSNYCTVTDTLSTDYKFKITPNSGYRVGSFTDKNCGIAGADAADKSNYPIVLVTTTSYIKDGQAVIDDIYSKLAALEARLNNS